MFDLQYHYSQFEIVLASYTWSALLTIPEHPVSFLSFHVFCTHQYDACIWLNDVCLHVKNKSSCINYGPKWTNWNNVQKCNEKYQFNLRCRSRIDMIQGYPYSPSLKNIINIINFLIKEHLFQFQITQTALSLVMGFNLTSTNKFQ